MGRKRTGIVEPAGFFPDGQPRFKGRLRLGDGTKSPRFEIPVGMTMKQAKKWVDGFQAKEDAEGAVLASKRAAARAKAAEAGIACDGESTDAWFGRYLPTKECGASYRNKCRTQWNRWVSPLIGEKPVASLTRDDIELVRDHLDKAIDDKKIRASTAANVWSIVTSAMKAATNSKERSLRVHSTPLCFGVLPPKRGASRKRPWLYPNEFERLAKCEAVSLDWRRTFTIALYTGLRPGELKALIWADVDLDARVLHISKAYDEHCKEVKTTKTVAGHRIVPIHPELLPLLEVMKRKPHDPVAPILSLSDDRVVVHFRDALKAAGIDRPRLWSLTETEEPADYRTLRDTCATWMALAGIYPTDIKETLGHESLTTTEKYIKVASPFRNASIGTPFPPLPAELLGSDSSQRLSQPPATKRRSPGFTGASSVARACNMTFPPGRRPEFRTIGCRFPWSFLSGGSDGP